MEWKKNSGLVSGCLLAVTQVVFSSSFEEAYFYFYSSTT